MNLKKVSENIKIDPSPKSEMKEESKKTSLLEKIAELSCQKMLSTS